MLIKLTLQIPSQECVILGAELSGPCEKDQNLLTQETQRSLKLYVLPLKEVIPYVFPEGRVREEVQGVLAGPGNTCLPHCVQDTQCQASLAAPADECGEKTWQTA